MRFVVVSGRKFYQIGINQNTSTLCRPLLDGRERKKIFRCVLAGTSRFLVSVDIVDPDSMPPSEWDMAQSRYLFAPNLPFGVQLIHVENAKRRLYRYVDFENDILVVGYYTGGRGLRLLIYDLALESIFPFKSQALGRY